MNPCTEGPRLARIETKLDTMAEVIRDLAVQSNEITHLKKAVEPIPDLVKWQERWGGGFIAISLLGTVAGVLAAIKVFL